MWAFTYLLGFSANGILDQVDWDVTRFADRVKNTHPRDNGEPALDDLNLTKYFKNPELGDVNEPATLVDRYDRIMVWYLPDIFYPSLIVSLGVFRLASGNDLVFLGYLKQRCYST